MPVLEAMACGTPVITANNSSMPEVAGDAAVQVDAEDAEGLSREIEQLTDPARRGGAIRAGHRPRCGIQLGENGAGDG